jgi:hypothetical protein
MNASPAAGRPRSVTLELSSFEALDLRFALRDAANAARGTALVMEGRQDFEAAGSLRDDASRYDAVLARLAPIIESELSR